MKTFINRHFFSLFQVYPPIALWMEQPPVECVRCHSELDSAVLVCTGVFSLLPWRSTHRTELDHIMNPVMIFTCALFGWVIFAGATNFLASNVVAFITLNEVILFLAYLAQAYLFVRRIDLIPTVRDTEEVLSLLLIHRFVDLSGRCVDSIRGKSDTYLTLLLDNLTRKRGVLYRSGSSADFGE